MKSFEHLKKKHFIFCYKNLKKLLKSGSRSISVEGGVLEGGKEKREDKRGENIVREVGVEN